MALDNYKIKLKEARILAQINRESLGQTFKRKPSEIRKELIEVHIKRGGTQLELKKRVTERLNIVPKKQVQNIGANIVLIDTEVDELLEFNEFDTEHPCGKKSKSLFMKCVRLIQQQLKRIRLLRFSMIWML